MRIRVLGPVEVELGGGWFAPGPPKQRAVLATLALNAGHSVSARTLVEVLWGEHAPASAVRNVQKHVWRLRQLVGERLRSRPPGYVLELEPEELDAARFAELLTRGRQAQCAGDLIAAASHLTAALEVWRGPALSDLVATGTAVELAQRLDEERIRALRQLVDVEIAAGRGEALLPQLGTWVAAHPLDEPLRERYIRLLLRLGRQAEALEAYIAAAAVLRTRLGTRPGTRLEILAAAAGQAMSSTGRVVAADAIGAAALPLRLLPATPTTFVGRRAEISRLADLLAPRMISVPVVAIGGPGGVGKSALTIRVAHHMADEFPDGQLYVNLNGSSPDLDPVRPHNAMRSLLAALGVRMEEVPADPDAVAALYRVQMSGRAFLLLLDNAAGSDQVRPLLPGGGGCAVLISARQPLTDLDGVTQLQLGTLPDDDAAELLTALIGADRVAADQAADQAAGLTGLIRACGGLALALRVAGARLASRPSWSLCQFSRRLGDERHRLNELRVGDLAVRTTFAVSYQHLTEPARLVFRRCGLFPGPDFGVEPLAVLTGLEPARVGVLLESLVDAALLQSNRPARYHPHDLVRIYAAECAREDDEAIRNAAVERLATWYLGVADQADRLITPGRGRPAVPADVSIEPHLRLDDRTQALAWFEVERPTLLALVRAAVRHGLHDIAARLPSVLKGFLELRGFTDDWIACHRIGLDSARRLPDLTVRARILNGLGSGYWRQERHTEAIECYQQSLELVRALGDRVKEAVLLNNLGSVAGDAGDHATAETYLRQALAMRRDVGRQLDESFALHNLGHVYHECWRFGEALPLLERALALRQRRGDRKSQGVTLHCLGDTLLGLGRDADADDAVRQALTIFIEVGDRYGRASALHTLGRIRVARGQSCEAIDHLRRAAAIYRDLGRAHDRARALAELELAERGSSDLA